MKRKIIIAVLAAVLAVVVLALSAGASASRNLSSPDYNDYGDDNYHECICSCGTVIHQPHNWVEIHSKGENYIPEFHCTDCGAVSYMQ